MPESALTPVQEANVDQVLASILEASELPLKACQGIELLELNAHAQMVGFNMTLDPTWLKEHLPHHTEWCLVRAFTYDDHIKGETVPRHLRCFVYIPFGNEGLRHRVLLDMSIEDFSSLVSAAAVTSGNNN